jgi:ligand-binding SRPBCC domain-containing protein
MAVHSLERTQCIPADLERVWSFFSDPVNLPLITPPHMQFKILSSGDSGGAHPDGPNSSAGPRPGPRSSPQIYAGQIIEYRLRPLPFFRTYWMTEITHVQEGRYFVDEQRRGPYSLWHHQHHFSKIEGGVEMTDIVHYALPFGFIGNLVHPLFVRQQLEGIFQYRFQRVEGMFGKYIPA